MKECHNCGAQVDDAAAVCRYCAAQLVDGAPIHTDKFAPQPPRAPEPPPYEAPGEPEPPRTAQPGTPPPAPGYNRPYQAGTQNQSPGGAYQPPNAGGPYGQQQAPYAQQPPYNAAPQAPYQTAHDPRYRNAQRVVAGVLALLLGSLGIHKFYMGKVGMGFLYLAFCWTSIPGIVGFVEGILYLCMDDYSFREKYCRLY